MWMWIGVACVAALAAANLILGARIVLARGGEARRPQRDRSPRAKKSPPSGAIPRPAAPRERPIPSGVQVGADDVVRTLDGTGTAMMADSEVTHASDCVILSASARTDKGLRRIANEDEILSNVGGVFAVADGMGGHSAGDVASRVALAALREAFQSGELGEPIDNVPPRASELIVAVRRAHEAVRRAAAEREEGEDMGTTLVAARFSTKKRAVYIANVGDSRCYRIRDGRAVQITRDHVTPAKGAKGSRLNRALGVMDRLPIDLHLVTTRPGDSFLLCSDGLWTHVPEARMTALVQSRTNLEEVVRRLVAEAVYQGSRDDVSAILVRIAEPDL